MNDLLEKVINGLQCKLTAHYDTCKDCPYFSEELAEDYPEFEYFCNRSQMESDAIELLKAQELPPVKPEKLEERTTEWLDKMTAKERLEEIAAILDDWDGYRTAKGLGTLINEVWAYALYPVKEQESFQPFRSGGYHPDWCCGNCKYPGLYGRMKFCPECGKAVKWE